MEIGVVGKPNVGKSTLFNALTLLDVPMAPYPFTTIKPNRGVGAVRVPCPHGEKGVPCTPGNATCRNGIRFVPVSLIDVPGLVPGASEGKGLGHQFLDDLRAADGFLHVVDASGGTGPDGTLAKPGSFDPLEEVGWLEEELVGWVAEILARDFDRAVRTVELEGGKTEEFLAKRLTGLAIPAATVAAVLRRSDLDREHPSRWTTEQRRALARELLHDAKPRLIAGNKADRIDRGAAAALTEAVAPIPFQPTLAEAELSLRRAARGGLLEYSPGDGDFRELAPERLNEAQRRALSEVRLQLATWGGTGVQSALERLVFERLRRIVVFPVEDETHWTDSKGRVLPDAFLVPADTAAREIAYRVHTDLGENFIRAIDGRTHRALGAEHPVPAGAVLRIVAKR